MLQVNKDELDKRQSDAHKSFDTDLQNGSTSPAPDQENVEVRKHLLVVSSLIFYD